MLRSTDKKKQQCRRQGTRSMEVDFRTPLSGSIGVNLNRIWLSSIPHLASELLFISRAPVFMEMEFDLDLRQ